MLVAPVVLAVLAGCAASTSDGSSNSASSAATDPEPTFSAPKLPWPSNGNGSIGVGGAGCLEISVPDGDEAYYAKLGRGYDLAWDAFLWPGTTRRFDVPVGTFQLTYGAGETWYGWQHAFGPKGAYSETSETFTFDDGQCWDVELILQVGGNLGSSGLEYDQF